MALAGGKTQNINVSRIMSSKQKQQISARKKPPLGQAPSRKQQDTKHTPDGQEKCSKAEF